VRCISLFEKRAQQHILLQTIISSNKSISVHDLTIMDGMEFDTEITVLAGTKRKADDVPLDVTAPRRIKV